MATRVPNLRLERSWMSAGLVAVVGSDEVGRGSLAGPVSAGVVLIDPSTKRPPTGLRDSKLLSASAREALVPRIERWAVASAVGHASAAEIDQVGILRALRLAGERALHQIGRDPDVILLDGNYDWFSRPARCASSPRPQPVGRVELRVKADLAHASVAAASVLAKVVRDHLMEELAVAHQAYGWHVNKGYATPEHLGALRELGPCEQHRRSWKLPGCGDEQMALDLRDDAPTASRVAGTPDRAGATSRPSR